MSSSRPRKSSEGADSPFPSPSPGARSPLASRSRFSLPQHESPQRPAVNRSSTARRGSTASLASSIGGTLDTIGRQAGEFNELSQNSISTLLSPAIVRTGLIAHTSLPPSAQHRAPSARDIPPVTLTSIPHVESSSFKPYLSSVGALYDAYQRAKAANDEATSLVFGKKDDEADYFPSLSRKTSQSSLQSLRRPSIMSPQSPNPPSPSRPLRKNNTPTPLSTIPNVYFDEDFHLENPRTFDVVSEKLDVIPPPLPGAPKDGSGDGRLQEPTRRRALHTNAILQEKLSWYMDTVEVHLIQAISQASTSFFAALGSLKALQSEADESLKSVQALRATLKDLDDGMAVGGLEIAKLKRRRQNISRLSEAVSQLCLVVEKAKFCEELVDHDQLSEAAVCLSEVQSLISGETGRKVDLRRLNALKGVSDGMLELRLRIGRGYEGQFVDALLTDLRQHVQSVPPKRTLHRWAHASLRSRAGMVAPVEGSPAYMIPNEQLRPQLKAALAGLTRSGHTARAATAYRDAVLREIKTMIRRHLPSSSDDDVESIASTSTRGGRKLNQQEKSAILARNLRNLDPESAEELLVKMYTSVGEALRRLGVQVKVLLDVTLSIEQPAPPATPEDAKTASKAASVSDISGEVLQALDMSSLLGQAVDLIQTQVVKVLKVRADQSSRLPLQRFLRYFVLNRLFRDECEAVSSRPGETIQQVVNAHVAEFLTTMSEFEKQEVRRVLDADRWEAVEFNKRDSAALDRILQVVNSTPKAWLQFTSLWDEIAASANDDSIAAVVANGDATPPQTGATIDSQRYMLVASAVTILHGFDIFLNFTAGIPFMAPDAATRLLDYLKLTNSRAVQLILGAGATKSAGLKNITTKHLALASQLCAFVVALIPYAREFVRRQATSSAVGSALQEFDRVKRLFQDHQTSIHDKLVEIMAARCSAHIKAFKTIDFDTVTDMRSPSPYVEALAKETGTLHRVLSKHVSETDLRMVMVPIFSHYSTDWGKAIMEAVSSIKTEDGKARLLKDMQYLDSKLSRMEGADDFPSQLVKIVEAIVIVPPTPGKTSTEQRNGTITTPATASTDTGVVAKDASQGQAPSTDPAKHLSPPAPAQDQGQALKTSLDIMGHGSRQNGTGPKEDPSALFDADTELAAADGDDDAEKAQQANLPAAISNDGVSTSNEAEKKA